MSCKKKALAALIGSIFVVSATQAMAGSSSTSPSTATNLVLVEPAHW